MSQLGESVSDGEYSGEILDKALGPDGRLQAGGPQAAAPPPDLADAPRREELWLQIQENIKHQLGLERYAIWFNKTVLMGLDGDSLVVGVPNVIVKQYLEEEYREAVRNAAGELLGPGVKISFDVEPGLLQEMRARQRVEADGQEGQGKIETASVEVEPARERIARANAGSPRPGPAPSSRLRLDEMVVTEANRWPYLAACEITCQGTPRFAFLLVLGGHGVGKTTLLQAICGTALACGAVERYEYAMAEGWGNDYYHAIQGKKTWSFRKRYRSSGMLAIDDMEFLDGKMGAQDELVHTIKSLLDAGRRVVLSSAIHPKDFAEARPALRSLVADTLCLELAVPPQKERMALARELARRRGLKADDSVFGLLAERCGGSMRELSGAVRSLAACASMEGADRAGFGMLHRVIGAAAGARRRMVGLGNITQVLTEFLPVTQDQLAGAGRTRSVCQARQIGMYLARRLTPASLSEIGRFFGGRKHSTVKHALGRIEQLIESDPEAADIVRQCEARLTRA